jgi:lysophospholipase L1-like esterase
MDINSLFFDKDEKPLERIPSDGGFCGIFRTIGCIGDSLASGEFESMDENGINGYHDMFDYSWGQYIARQVGSKVYNFSRGGMTAKEYWDSFAQENDFWSDDKLCQAYIIALGFNDLYGLNMDVGSVKDIDLSDYNNNANTFAGYYARIIQKLKAMQPQARFFLMTLVREEPEKDIKVNAHAELLHSLTDVFDYTYVLDFAKYGPVYDDEFKKKFYLGGHMNPAGYILTARMTAAYIDYYIRHDMAGFAQIPFIGEDFYNQGARR